MEVDLPTAALRLFPEFAAGSAAAAAAGAAPGALRLDAAAPDPHVLARLLEDGDGADLAWLCGQLPEAALAAWVAAHGGRRLSRRSLAFWSRVLGGAPAGEPAASPVGSAAEAGFGSVAEAGPGSAAEAGFESAAEAGFESAADAALARRRPLWLL